MVRSILDIPTRLPRSIQGLSRSFSPAASRRGKRGQCLRAKPQETQGGRVELDLKRGGQRGRVVKCQRG